MTKAQKQRLRDKARAGQLPWLFLSQNGLCHWCHSSCAIVRYIPQEMVISLERNKVIWRLDENTVFSSPIATVDHLTPIRDGGDNDDDNVVMSCAYCNGKRTKQKREGHNRMCRSCGMVPPYHGYRTCKECFSKNLKEWLASQGWSIVQSHTDQKETRFFDHFTGDVCLARFAAKIAKERLGIGGRWHSEID